MATSAMPSWEYNGMKEADLGAIYDYLRTVPASANEVVSWEPAPADGAE